MRSRASCPEFRTQWAAFSLLEVAKGKEGITFMPVPPHGRRVVGGVSSPTLKPLSWLTHTSTIGSSSCLCCLGEVEGSLSGVLPVVKDGPAFQSAIPSAG